MTLRNTSQTKWASNPPVDEFLRHIENARKAMKLSGFDAIIAFFDEFRYANVRGYFYLAMTANVIYFSDFRPATINALGGLYTQAMVLVPLDGEPTIFVPDNQIPFCKSVSFI
jgi:hypothetical protein